MKYIKVLEPVNLKNLLDQEIVQEDKDGSVKLATMDFKTFLLQRIGDQKLSTTMESLKVVARIKKAVDQASDYVVLETADWQSLLEVIKNPSSPYNPTFAYCLLPFMKAVEDAVDELTFE